MLMPLWAGVTLSFSVKVLWCFWVFCRFFYCNPSRSITFPQSKFNCILINSIWIRLLFGCCYSLLDWSSAQLGTSPMWLNWFFYKMLIEVLCCFRRWTFGNWVTIFTWCCRRIQRCYPPAGFASCSRFINFPFESSCTFGASRCNQSSIPDQSYALRPLLGTAWAVPQTEYSRIRRKSHQQNIRTNHALCYSHPARLLLGRFETAGIKCPTCHITVSTIFTYFLCTLKTLHMFV